MPGGLLNLTSHGNLNTLLHGNPKKSFFRTTYHKHTNFGMQKFRLDFDGQKSLRMNQSSVFKFKVPRHADLLMDSYLVVNLPTIWSPVVPPNCEQTTIPGSPLSTWQPYEFKWINNLGTQMIESIRFFVDGNIIQEFTGQYLLNLVERDFTSEEKQKYYEMTGNVNELNNPANSNSRVNVYPSVLVHNSEAYDTLGPNPSIPGRKLYIPLHAWFSQSSKLALPLVALQYSEVSIEITIRPVNELYVVRYIAEQEYESAGYYHKADLTNPLYSFYKFLHPPTDVSLSADSYADKRTNWNADIHIISTYAFLGEVEQKWFAEKQHKYLIKHVYTKRYENVVGSSKIDLKSLGMVSNWMWFLQRSDVGLRNEWSNYTNWPFNSLPYNIFTPIPDVNVSGIDCSGTIIYPNTDKFGNPISISMSGLYQPLNIKEIQMNWGLEIDGKDRESVFDSGVFNYIEKYSRIKGTGKDGTYYYNFCIDPTHKIYQPSGGFNTSKFNKIEFLIKTIEPTLDTNAQFSTICDNEGNIIGTNKPMWGIYNYTYDLVVMEERYNRVVFSNGTASLEFAR